MGIRGDWNTDFTQDDPQSPYGLMALPCCCGPQCSQTKAFVQSAQMNNFDTLVTQCKSQLSACSSWPEGVTEVDYGDAGTIKKKDPNGDRCVY